MPKTMKRLLAAALALTMLLACTACDSDAGSGDTASAADTSNLNIRIPDAFATLDPHNWSLDTDFTLCFQIYEPLYSVDDETNEHPVLATGYTVADDGMSYTFTLRDDAYFTNGEQMTASDVKFSIERAVASAYLNSNVSTVEAVEADDAANTVVVSLSEPTPGLIEGLSHVLIVNQKYVEEHQDENGMLGFNACGTGPYMLKEYTQDVSVIMEANPDYREGAPAVDTLTFQLIVDENTALTAFEAGELDIARFNISAWDRLKTDDRFGTAELTTNHVTYMIMNLNQAPFDDPLVREAIACAVNRDDIITMAMDGMAAPTYTLVTSLMTSYADIEPDYTYDPDRARELLAEAGYADGLDIGQIQAPSGTYFADAAVVLQQQLAEVGITSTLQELEINTLVANAMSGNFGMCAMGQTNTYDMSWVSTYYGTEHIGSMNMAGYSNPDVDAKLQEASTCMDPEERVSLYQALLEQLDEECIYVPLFNKTLCIAWNANLNYTPTVRAERFADVSWNTTTQEGA